MRLLSCEVSSPPHEIRERCPSLLCVQKSRPEGDTIWSREGGAEAGNYFFPLKGKGASRRGCCFSAVLHKSQLKKVEEKGFVAGALAGRSRSEQQLNSLFAKLCSEHRRVPPPEKFDDRVKSKRTAA